MFELLQALGHIATDEMFRAFNMGIGLIVVGARENVERIVAILESGGEQPVTLGQIIPGDREVRY
jgi:phosphoribosylformylglycinamidine cyclo-ligase